MAVTTLAVVVLIPGALGRRLNALRRRFDPAGLERIAAHIPLVGPFEAEPPFGPLEQHCWRTGHTSAPFEVALGLLTIDEERRLLYGQVASGGEELAALRERLLAGGDAPAARDEAPYLPRAVVAQPEQASDLDLARREAVGRHLDSVFFLERVELMARYPDGTWYQRDFYTLDRAAVRT